MLRRCTHHTPSTPFCTLTLASTQADTTLVFESRFESGNLRRAIQVYPFEYDLVLHPDVNTRGHTQWFFFSVSNTRAGVPYKFNIINLMKDDSLYNDGMLPLVHSRKGEQATGLGWHRAGSSVAYYSNMVPRGRRRRCVRLCGQDGYKANGGLTRWHVVHASMFV